MCMYIYIYTYNITMYDVYIYIDVSLLQTPERKTVERFSIQCLGWRRDLFFPTCQARVSRSQWALPDLNRELQSSARGSDPTARARCQWACRCAHVRRECRIECQNRCQKECQNRCQKGCLIGRQNRCRIECHKRMSE